MRYNDTRSVVYTPGTVSSRTPTTRVYGNGRNNYLKIMLRCRFCSASSTLALRNSVILAHCVLDEMFGCLTARKFIGSVFQDGCMYALLLRGNWLLGPTLYSRFEFDAETQV